MNTLTLEADGELRRVYVGKIETGMSELLEIVQDHMDGVDPMALLVVRNGRGRVRQLWLSRDLWEAVRPETVLSGREEVGSPEGLQAPGGSAALSSSLQLCCGTVGTAGALKRLAAYQGDGAPQGETAIAGGDKPEAEAALRVAEPYLMRGVGKGVMHRNTAARKLSRLSKQIKEMAA